MIDSNLRADLRPDHGAETSTYAVTVWLPAAASSSTTLTEYHCGGVVGKVSGPGSQGIAWTC